MRNVATTFEEEVVFEKPRLHMSTFLKYLAAVDRSDNPPDCAGVSYNVSWVTQYGAP